MKRLIFCCVLVLFQLLLFAQVRLDVEGDAKIEGTINLIKAAGDSSLFIGANAGMNDTPAFGNGSNYNTYVGVNAGRYNTIGINNSFFGNKSGYQNTLGGGNSFFGGYSGFYNSGGHSNSFFGYGAGRSNTTGDSNAFFGRDAGYGNTTGELNAFFGKSAGVANTTGDSNVFFGRDAGPRNTTGDQNTFLGAASGYFNETGNGNTFIGIGSGFSSSIYSGLNHSIAIGYLAQVSCENCAVIGGIDENAVNLGIGLRSPQDRLHLYKDGKASIKLNTDNMGITSLKLFERDNFGFEIMNSGVTNTLFIHRSSNTGILAPLAQWDRSGFFINHGNADIKGNIYHNGSLIHSDRRYKKQIKAIQKPIEKLHRISGVTYAYRTKEFTARNFDDQRTIGVIAQEVEKVFPELVQENQDGYKAVNYDGLIPVLIEATKEQQQLIDHQKAILETQSDQLTDQQQQIDELKGLVKQLLAASTAPQKTNNHTLTLGKTASLEQNQPNPFGETTLVNYYVPENTQNASLQVTSLNGKVLGITQLVGTGHGQVNIQAHTFPAGTYYYSLVVDGQVVATKKMVLANR